MMIMSAAAAVVVVVAVVLMLATGKSGIPNSLCMCVPVSIIPYNIA
jgi:hypothetical protein